VTRLPAAGPLPTAAQLQRFLFNPSVDGACWNYWG
jgi:hypothetical protein